MRSTVMDFKCQTIETNTDYPVVCISAELMLGKRGEIRCVDTGSLRDQIEKAVVSTIAIVEKGGAK
jgi:hypothetical protein